MYLCYIDESGTPDIPGNTSHYVLAGLSVPISYWKSCDKEIESVLVCPACHRQLTGASPVMVTTRVRPVHSKC